MAVPTFKQSKTAASDSSASTSHVITLDNAIPAPAGTEGPRVLILQISYDGNTGSLVSGITDTLSNTWQVGTDGSLPCRATNGAGVNGEMWYAVCTTGGAAPTITVTTSSSVKAKLAVAEIDQVRPVTPIDKTTGRIHVPAVNSTARTSADTTGGSAYTTKRDGMISCHVGGTAWNDTRTISSNGTTWTGTGSQLVQLSGGSSNLGVGIQCKATTSEVANVTANQTIGRFTMSASDQQPNAVMSIAFFRDGVITSTTEDGCIQNIENVAVADTGGGAVWSFWNGNGVYKSSTSAPGGGTGASETDHAYGFFPDYSSYLLTNVTIASTFSLNVITDTGFDDGTNFMAPVIYVYKNGTFGTTLTTADDVMQGSPALYPGTGMCVAGAYSYSLDTATYFNTSGYTTVGIEMSGDTQGGSSNTWVTVLDRHNSVPMYLKLTLNYPARARSFATIIG